MPTARFAERHFVRLLGALLAMAALAVHQRAAAQDITTGLVGHWRLTETSGTTAADGAGSQQNGTYLNGVSLASSTAVPVDGAIAAKFDGYNDYVSIASESTFDFTGAMTVACWVRVDQFDADYQAIVCKGDSAWRLAREGATNLLQFACSGLSTIKVTSSHSVNDGKWHHVAGVFTGSQLRIYVDGVLSNSVSAWGSISTNNYPVEIARNGEASGREFDGAIYDVRVYNRALSIADIAYIYLQGGPIGHWKLNQTSGSTATDSSIVGNNGTYQFGVTLGQSSNVPCGTDYAAQFDGTDDRVVLGNIAHDLSDGFTIAAWARPTNVASWQRIVDFGRGTDLDNIFLGRDTLTTNLQLTIHDGSAGTQRLTAAGALETDVWHHYVGTCDASGNAKLYRDGVQIASGNIGVPANVTRTVNYIADSNWAADASFQGRIRDVRLYNRPLSAVEVANIYGLMGHWKFAEGTGTTAADSSPLGLNATLSGGAIWTTACDGSKALQTNGSGGIAQTGSSFTPPAEGTVAFWMRPTAGSTVRRIFGNGGDWEARQQPGDTVVFDLCADGGTIIGTTEPLNDATRWYHLAFSYSSTDDTYELYVDGQLDKSGVNANDLVQQPSGALSFGTRTGSTEYWGGSLRDFRVYSRKLCASEIAELAGLAGRWKFDETSGTVASDASGHGRNGTVSGTATWTAGKFNNCLQMNAATKVTVAGLMNEPKNVTLAAWVDLTSPDPNGAEVISLGDHIAIRLDDGSTSRAFFYNGSTWVSATANQTFAGAGWKHVAAVFNDDDNTLKLYINGAEAASLNTTASIVWTGLGGNTVFGAHANGNSNVDFNGKIDDARIYTRTLCPSEILELYGGGQPPGVRVLQWVEVR